MTLNPRIRALRGDWVSSSSIEEVTLYQPWKKQRDEDIFLGRCVHAKLLQSCLTLFNTMDRSLPGSPVHGIPQARTLEWVAMTNIYLRG